MRLVEWENIGSVNSKLEVYAVDSPNVGGGCCRYEIHCLGANLNPSTTLMFQNGSPEEVGINGITNEALLAVIIDRLKGFQSGPFSTRENSIAITKFEEGLMWLQKRTRDRLARGVEGTYQK